MRTELEDAIAETMRSHGDGKVDVEALRQAAVRRGGGIRRRRLMAASAGLALVAATVAVVPAVRDGGVFDGLTGTGVGEPSDTASDGDRMITLPPADAPGAGRRPDLVGTDPAVLHFDLDLTGENATGVYWSVRGGIESATVWVGAAEGNTRWYQLTSDPARLDAGKPSLTPAETRQLSVGDRPAVARLWHDRHGTESTVWTLDWQPVDGLWARVEQDDGTADALIPAAGALLLNRSQRCVAPMRIDPLPAGYTVTGCGVDAGPLHPWTASDIEFTDPAGTRFRVGIGRVPQGGDWATLPRHPDRRFNDFAADRPTLPRAPFGARILSRQLHGDFYLLVVGISNSGVEPTVPAEKLEALANAVVPGPNFTDPRSWPTRPVR